MQNIKFLNECQYYFKFERVGTFCSYAIANVPFNRYENITLFFMCNCYCFIIRHMPDDFSAVSKNTE